MFGNSLNNNFASIQIMFSAPGDPLFIVILENEVMTDVALQTLDMSDGESMPDLRLKFQTYPNKIVMTPEALKEAFNELDWSLPFATIILSPNPPFFRLITNGPSGSCQVDYPKNSDVFESFECQITQNRSYKLKSLQACVKALGVAEKNSNLHESRWIAKHPTSYQN